MYMLELTENRKRFMNWYLVFTNIFYTCNFSLKAEDKSDLMEVFKLSEEHGNEVSLHGKLLHGSLVH